MLEGSSRFRGNWEDVGVKRLQTPFKEHLLSLLRERTARNGE